MGTAERGVSYLPAIHTDQTQLAKSEPNWGVEERSARTLVDEWEDRA